MESVESLLEAVYRKDLFDDGISAKSTIKRPTDDAICALRAEAAEAKKRHHENVDAAKMKRRDGGWEGAAKEHLFRAKRCEALAKLLAIRLVFQDVGFTVGTKKELRQALASTAARTAIGQVVRTVKAEHVGIDMMDVTVCGAIAPYNRILGGKLICTLLTSPEVVEYYRQRYDGQESIIASSMKGKGVPPSPVPLLPRPQNPLRPRVEPVQPSKDPS